MTLNINIKSTKTASKDTALQSVVNFSAVLLIVGIFVLIYKYFIAVDNNKLRFEGFEDVVIMDTEGVSGLTIYEKSMQSLYSSNKRLLCGMNPMMNGGTGICYINKEPVIIYQYPVHLIKLNDGSILAVFNDGRLYQKDSMTSTLWAGPITNSLPNNIVPLRMVTLSRDLITLLGVGYDNILYTKTPDIISGLLDITTPWLQVPNNSSIIYVLFDNQTNFLISIDINGKLFTKTSFDITSNNQELVTKLDRPVLRLYYDLNGYMLAIDNKFNLYQFTELNWKTSGLNITRGYNNSKIQDLLYDNNGQMYGLVFNPDAFMVQIMKQNAVFYLADFVSLDSLLSKQSGSASSTDTSLSSTVDFVMTDQDIIKCKIGSLHDYLTMSYNNDLTDDDPNFAFQKQIIENKAKLKTFCANRGSSVASNNYNNYDLLASVDKNNNKINQLKNIVSNLLVYEPDSARIQEQYPIIAQT